MVSLREKFFKRCPEDSEDLRKQKALNYLIVSFIIIALILFVIFYSLSLIGISLDREEAFLTLHFGSLIFIIITIFIFIINNYFSRIIAIYTFLFQTILLIILADTPHELLNGRSIIYFIIPIIIGAITIRPYSGLVVAISVDIIMITIGIINEILPSIPAMLIFIIIGAIMGISAQSIKKAIKESKNAYKQIEFLKDIFSHDINNILQNIKSSTQLLPVMIEGINKNNEIETILTILKEQIERGARLVSNIRKLSQIDEKMTINKINALPILIKVIDYVKKTFSRRLIQINLKYKLNKVEILANELIIDVFENLLINAILHNKQNHIEIDIIITEIKIEEKYMYKFQFIDNGIGIKDDLKEKIFLRTHNIQKDHGGLGLGLSLIKIILEKFKSKIWIENAYEDDYSKGSNFILLIPKVH